MLVSIRNKRTFFSQGARALSRCPLLRQSFYGGTCTYLRNDRVRITGVPRSGGATPLKTLEQANAEGPTVVLGLIRRPRYP